jgi:hypothetical protein
MGIMRAKKLYFLKIVADCMPLVEIREDSCIPIIIDSGIV